MERQSRREEAAALLPTRRRDGPQGRVCAGGRAGELAPSSSRFVTTLGVGPDPAGHLHALSSMVVAGAVT